MDTSFPTGILVVVTALMSVQTELADCFPDGSRWPFPSTLSSPGRGAAGRAKGGLNIDPFNPRSVSFESAPRYQRARGPEVVESGPEVVESRSQFTARNDQSSYRRESSRPTSFGLPSRIAIANQIGLSTRSKSLSSQITEHSNNYERFEQQQRPIRTGSRLDQFQRPRNDQQKSQLLPYNNVHRPQSGNGRPSIQREIESSLPRSRPPLISLLDHIQERVGSNVGMGKWRPKRPQTGNGQSSRSSSFSTQSLQMSASEQTRSESNDRSTQNGRSFQSSSRSGGFFEKLRKQETLSRRNNVGQTRSRSSSTSIGKVNFAIERHIGVNTRYSSPQAPERTQSKYNTSRKTQSSYDSTSRTRTTNGESSRSNQSTLYRSPYRSSRRDSYTPSKKEIFSSGTFSNPTPTIQSRKASSSSANDPGFNNFLNEMQSIGSKQNSESPSNPSYDKLLSDNEFLKRLYPVIGDVDVLQGTDSSQSLTRESDPNNIITTTEVPLGIGYDLNQSSNDTGTSNGNRTFTLENRQVRMQSDAASKTERSSSLHSNTALNNLLGGIGTQAGDQQSGQLSLDSIFNHPFKVGPDEPNISTPGFVSSIDRVNDFLGPTIRDEMSRRPASVPVNTETNNPVYNDVFNDLILNNNNDKKTGALKNFPGLPSNFDVTIFQRNTVPSSKHEPSRLQYRNQIKTTVRPFDISVPIFEQNNSPTNDPSTFPQQNGQTTNLKPQYMSTDEDPVISIFEQNYAPSNREQTLSSQFQQNIFQQDSTTPTTVFSTHQSTPVTILPPLQRRNTLQGKESTSNGMKNAPMTIQLPFMTQNDPHCTPATVQSLEQTTSGLSDQTNGQNQAINQAITVPPPIELKNRPITVSAPIQPTNGPITVPQPFQPTNGPITLPPPIQPTNGPITVPPPIQPTNGPITVPPPIQPTNGPITVIPPIQPTNGPITVPTPIQLTNGPITVPPPIQPTNGPITVIPPIQPTNGPIPVIPPIELKNGPNTVPPPIEPTNGPNTVPPPIQTTNGPITLPPSIQLTNGPITVPPPIQPTNGPITVIPPIQPTNGPIPVIPPIELKNGPNTVPPPIEPTNGPITVPQTFQPTNGPNTVPPHIQPTYGPITVPPPIQPTNGPITVIPPIEVKNGPITGPTTIEPTFGPITVLPPFQQPNGPITVIPPIEVRNGPITVPTTIEPTFGPNTVPPPIEPTNGPITVPQTFQPTNGPNTVPPHIQPTYGPITVPPPIQPTNGPITVIPPIEVKNGPITGPTTIEPTFGPITVLPPFQQPNGPITVIPPIEVRNGPITVPTTIEPTFGPITVFPPIQPTNGPITVPPPFQPTNGPNTMPPPFQPTNGPITVFPPFQPTNGPITVFPPIQPTNGPITVPPSFQSSNGPRTVPPPMQPTNGPITVPQPFQPTNGPITVIPTIQQRNGPITVPQTFQPTKVPITLPPPIQPTNEPITVPPPFQQTNGLNTVTQRIQPRNGPVSGPPPFQPTIGPITVPPPFQQTNGLNTVTQRIQPGNGLVSGPPPFQPTIGPITVPPPFQPTKGSNTVSPPIQPTNGPITVPQPFQLTNGPITVIPTIQPTKGPITVPRSIQPTNGPITVPPPFQPTNGPITVPPSIQQTNGPITVPPPIEVKNIPSTVLPTFRQSNGRYQHSYAPYSSPDINGPSATDKLGDGINYSSLYRVPVPASNSPRLNSDASTYKSLSKASDQTRDSQWESLTDIKFSPSGFQIKRPTLFEQIQQTKPYAKPVPEIPYSAASSGVKNILYVQKLPSQVNGDRIFPQPKPNSPSSSSFVKPQSLQSYIPVVEVSYSNANSPGKTLTQQRQQTMSFKRPPPSPYPPSLYSLPRKETLPRGGALASSPGPSVKTLRPPNISIPGDYMRGLQYSSGGAMSGPRYNIGNAPSQIQKYNPHVGVDTKASQIPTLNTSYKLRMTGSEGMLSNPLPVKPNDYQRKSYSGLISSGTQKTSSIGASGLPNTNFVKPETVGILERLARGPLVDSLKYPSVSPNVGSSTTVKTPSLQGLQRLVQGPLINQLKPETGSRSSGFGRLGTSGRAVGFGNIDLSGSGSPFQ